jgi:predicted nuclease of predicted toxin-antitoxin system
LKFLLDVHVSNRIARAIEESGHQIMRAALEFPTWPDDKLLALAEENGRIIVTQDSDFTDLIFAFGAKPPPSLIFIRCEPEFQPAMAERVVETIQSNRLIGHVVILTPKTSRYRAFPKMDLEND